MFRQKIIPLSGQMLEKCGPSSRQYKWMVATFSKFYSKIWVSFGLNTGEWFLLEVAVSDQLKEHRFFHKAALGIFKIAVRLRDQQVFMWRSVKTLNIFSTSNLKQIFQKTITFFKKLKYCFLVGDTKVENASFPYKTALSPADVETNTMVTTKWTYHKERSFSSNYFILFRILFQFKNLL